MNASTAASVTEATAALSMSGRHTCVRGVSPKSNRRMMMATPNKYDAGEALQWSLAADDVSISQHARHRYRERTPQHAEQAVGAAEAFRRGEYIEHPEICGKLHSNTDHGLERVRLYLHPCDDDGGYQWGVVFLIQQNRYHRDNPGQNRASTPLVVATTVSLKQIDHGPTKAYLSGRGAHRVDGGCS